MHFTWIGFCFASIVPAQAMLFNRKRTSEFQPASLLYDEESRFAAAGGDINERRGG
jgi:hypothetical protein